MSTKDNLMDCPGTTQLDFFNFCNHVNIQINGNGSFTIYSATSVLLSMQSDLHSIFFFFTSLHSLYIFAFIIRRAAR